MATKNQSLTAMSAHKFDLNRRALREASKYILKDKEGLPTNVMLHPTNRGRVVRVMRLGDVSHPVDAVRSAQEHWDNLGVEIPQASYGLKRTAPWRKPTLYASVQKIEGRDLSELIGRGELQTSEERLAVEGLIKAIDEYLTWAHKTGQTHILGDITDARQFRYGKPYGASENTPNKVYLLDMDPHFMHVGKDHLQNPDWNETAGSLAAWAAVHSVDINTPYNLQPDDSVVQLAQKY